MTKKTYEVTWKEVRRELIVADTSRDAAEIAENDYVGKKGEFVRLISMSVKMERERNV